MTAIRTKISNLFTNNNLENTVEYADKYLTHSIVICKQVLKDYCQYIKIIFYLYGLTYVLMYAGNHLLDAGNLSLLKNFVTKNKDMLAVIMNLCIFLEGIIEGLIYLMIWGVGFMMGLRFVHYLPGRAYIPMLDKEYLELTKKLESMDIIGNHINGELSYDWDLVLDTVYKKHIDSCNNEIETIYNKVKRHYHYLKFVSVNVKLLNCKEGLPD